MLLFCNILYYKNILGNLDKCFILIWEGLYMNTINN